MHWANYFLNILFQLAQLISSQRINVIPDGRADVIAWHVAVKTKCMQLTPSQGLVLNGNYKLLVKFFKPIFVIDSEVVTRRN